MSDSEGPVVNREELLQFHHQIDTRIARVENELDNLVSIKKWVMSLVLIFILQLGGFIYGYGGMSERLDNTVAVVETNTNDRYYRAEALALERELKAQVTSLRGLLTERKEATDVRIKYLEKRVDRLEK